MKNNLLILLLFTTTLAMGQRKFDTGDMIINSTIKIESVKKEIIAGKEQYTKSSGTGFFFEFTFGPNMRIPVIVTNKHVIKNAFMGTLYFKITDSSGMPIYGKSEMINISNFSDKWILHPDNEVDLAIYPLMPIVNEFKKVKKRDLFFVSIPEEFIPNDSIVNSLNAIEDIFMIGYPYGLRDTINDLPIVRRGITATPIYLDYNHKKEFLIDMPVFFGSSGSPIIIYNHGSWNSDNGLNISSGGRVIFLGINYATYTKNFEGKVFPVISENINDSLKTNTTLPLYNIGIITKSEKLLDFKPLIKKIINR